MPAKILALPMDERRARAIIRAAVDDSARLIWSDHAKQRMRKRRISPAQVLACLRHGVFVEGPYLDIKGGWRCTLRRLAAGEEVKVAVAIMPVSLVVVVTVM